MKQLLKWLYPGLGLKRWMLLGSLGFVFLTSGVAVLLDIRILTELMSYARAISLYVFGKPMSRLLALILVAGGALLMVVSIRRMVRSILLGFLPGNENKVMEMLYRQRRLKQGPKIVALGGGTGLSVLLRGLKKYTSNLTAVVTVTDDGGSSGRLRGELGILPPGDARNCLVALADTERLMEELFSYRFAKGELAGHNLGNLLLAAMTDITGSFDIAVQEISKVLAVQGQVFPSTVSDVELKGRMKDGSWVKGETALVSHAAGIERIFLEPHDAQVLPEALRLIEEADAIVLGPGSLYTSIIPNLLVKGMIPALQKSAAPVIYVCNIMTQPGETDGYTVADHVHAIHHHTGVKVIDFVMANDQPVSAGSAALYRRQGATPVKLDEERLVDMGVKVIKEGFVDENSVVRHHYDKLARRLVREVFNANNVVERLRMFNSYLGSRLKEFGEEIGG